MTLQITELLPGFAAAVQGADLSSDLDAAQVTAIRGLIDRHGVLVFHDQPMQHERQIAFSRHFGALETTISKGRQKRIPLEIVDLSNLDRDGNLLPPDSKKSIFDRGNEIWHSDSSFKPVPANYSLLSGREVPPHGGETEFADVRAAFDAWPGPGGGIAKEEMAGLICEHSIVYSRGVNTGDVFTEEQKQELPPVRQALIRTHPATGRKMIFVGSHASHVIGWPVDKGRELLQSLNEWCVQPRFTYRHVWRQHDLVMWDNRSVLHRGRPYDRTRHRRVMFRTTVAGDGPTAPAE